jgi:hypothetical protein
MRFSSGKSDLHYHFKISNCHEKRRCRTTCAVGYSDFHNLMGVVGSSHALSAVPPALPSPGGQPDLIVQLEPRPLVTERRRSETTVLGSLFINVNEQGQSPLVNRVLTGARTSKQYG